MKKFWSFVLKYIVAIIAFCVAGAGITMECINYDFNAWLKCQEIFGKDIQWGKMALVAALIGTGAFFAESIFYKNAKEIPDGPKRAEYLIGKGVNYFAGVVFAFLGIQNFIYLTGYFLILWTLGIYFIFRNKKKQNVNYSFEKFIARAFVNISIGVIAMEIIGLWILLASVFVATNDVLWNLASFIRYFIGFGLFMPMAFLSFLMVDRQGGKISRIIGKYILPCFISAVCAIFYLVVFVDFVTDKQISNYIIYLTYILFGFVITVWLMAEEYKDKKTYSVLISFMPVFYVPMIVVQSVFVIDDINRYGIGEINYLCIVLILYEIAVIVSGMVRKKNREDFLLIFCVLIAITAYAPKINIADLAEVSEADKTDKETQENSESAVRKGDAFEVENLFYELNIENYDSISCYEGQNKYILEDDTLILKMDLEHYRFESVNTGEEITVNIESFIDKCLETGHIYGSYMGEKFFQEELKEYYQIPIDETTTFCIQSVSLIYNEIGDVWDADDIGDNNIEWNEYVEWIDCNITGVLLKKDKSASETIDALMGSYTEDMKVHSVCCGDIGQDGKKDMAIVLEYDGELFDYSSNNRLLLIYEETAPGEYECIYSDRSLILDKNSGGIYGDPFVGMWIENGEFKVSLYGGSSSRWGYDYYFKLSEERFFLVRAERILNSTHTLNGIKTYYDYEKGTVREEVFTFIDDEEYLVYEDEFEPIKIPMADANFEELEQKNNYLINIQIGASHYDFFSDTAIPVILGNVSKYYTPSQALDLIKETYYPDMQKVMFEYSDEIFANREKLLGYEQPRYYYTDEYGNVLYYDYMSIDDDRVVHTIRCQGKKLKYILTDKESEDAEIEIKESFY